MPVQELLADKEVILAAVEQNGELLDFASEEPCREPRSGFRRPIPQFETKGWQPGNASNDLPRPEEQDFE